MIKQFQHNSIHPPTFDSVHTSLPLGLSLPKQIILIINFITHFQSHPSIHPPTHNPDTIKSPSATTASATPQTIPIYDKATDVAQIPIAFHSISPLNADYSAHILNRGLMRSSITVPFQERAKRTDERVAWLVS